MREVPLTVRADPRTGVSAAALRAQYALGIRVREALTRAHATIAEVRRLRAAPNGPGAALDSMERDLAGATRGDGGELVIPRPGIVDKLAVLAGRVDLGDGAPTAASLAVAAQMEKELAGHMTALARLSRPR
ncbi:MAG: hypothetical protein FJ034_09275 [Chloroflexi bacterium]|nr:hypothetical protein [Chloroflexota bacterium]